MKKLLIVLLMAITVTSCGAVAGLPEGEVNISLTQISAAPLMYTVMVDAWDHEIVLKGRNEAKDCTVPCSQTLEYITPTLLMPESGNDFRLLQCNYENKTLYDVNGAVITDEQVFLDQLNAGKSVTVLLHGCE